MFHDLREGGVCFSLSEVVSCGGEMQGRHLGGLTMEKLTGNKG